MTKYFLSCTLLAFVSGNSFCQNTKEKMNQLKKDPKTIENAAKADAGLINKKNVIDSTSTITTKKEKRIDCKCARKQKAISN